jgi:hypothetical protein
MGRTRHLIRFEIASLLVLLAPVAPAAFAQDVPGIEICTRESRLDRRTSCLQSNVEFLQQVIAKNALDAQQKLAAANRDIVALKEQLAGANRDVATLKEQLAAVQARIDALGKDAPAKDALGKSAPPAGPQKPEAKPPAK